MHGQLADFINVNITTIDLLQGQRGVLEIRGAKEGPRCPLSPIMQQLGHQVLARANGALDKNGQITRGKARHRAEDRLHHGAAPDHRQAAQFGARLRLARINR